MKEVPQQVSESVRRRNPHLYSARDVATIGFQLLAQSAQPPNPLKRIRQSAKPLMNKLEQEWFDYLKATFPLRQFYPQTTRFKLGNGIWYKPDVTCPYFDGVFTCWEVKGPKAFRGGFENLKVAAAKYPEFKWILVWKDNGQWREQAVLP